MFADDYFIIHRGSIRSYTLGASLDLRVSPLCWSNLAELKLGFGSFF